MPSAVAPGGFDVRSQSRPAPPFARTTAFRAYEPLPLTCAQQLHASAAPILHDQAQRERLLQDDRIEAAVDRGDQRTLDLGAGGVARM